MILDSLKKEESCFKDLIDKIGEQKKAIEDKDEVRVLEIIEEKERLAKVYQEKFASKENELDILSKDIEEKNIKDNSRNNIKKIEEITGNHISLISYGPDRNQTFKV